MTCTSPGEAHRDTGKAWDVVARAKYRHELGEHVAHLAAGGHNLLPPELEVVGDLLPGARVVQLQCSHGLDALGLLNAGAASVVGVDLSEEMIAQARAKAEVVGATAATFLCADVVALPADLDATADLVYTGRGSLPWIMDLEAWARSVRRVLRPGGHVFVFEGHPLASLWDRETPALELRPRASYFADEPAEEPGFPARLVARESGATRPRMLERHWRPGQVMAVLIAEGLEVRVFREFPDPFWEQFPHWPEGLRGRLPLTYALLARRGAGDEPDGRPGTS